MTRARSDGDIDTGAAGVTVPSPRSAPPGLAASRGPAGGDPARDVDLAASVDDHADVHNPWHGIPVELLYATRGYDTDSAGGCG